MNRKSFCLTLLFTIIFFSLIWKVSAGIGGAEPEYNYREFLIEDFHYDFSVAADSPDPVRDYLLIWQQGYSPDYSTSSFFGWRDSEFSAEIGINYWQVLQQSRFTLGYRDEHRISFHYYKWRHKRYLGLGDLDLINNFTYSFSEISQLSVSNNLRYLFHHESVPDPMENDLQDLSLSGDLGFYTPHWGLVSSYHFPFRHEWKKYGVSPTYYRLWESFLLGVGLTFIEDDSATFFPYITARYISGNRLILRVKMKEDFVSYPYQEHFLDHQLLWRSSLPELKDDINPYPEREYSAGVDLFALGILQKVSLIYRSSERKFAYAWIDDDDPLFIISSQAKRHESVQIDYALNYQDTDLQVSYHPQDRRDFQPLLSVGVAQKLTYRVFNDLLLAVDYHHQEKIMTRSESRLERRTDDYFNTKLTYRFTKIKNLILESAVNYPVLRPAGSYYKISPDFFVRISYGTMRYENPY